MKVKPEVRKKPQARIHLGQFDTQYLDIRHLDNLGSITIYQLVDLMLFTFERGSAQLSVLSHRLAILRSIHLTGLVLR